MSGTVWDAPNQEVVGVGPPWVEGTGGIAGDPTAVEAESESAGSDLDAMTKAELLDYAKQIGASPANNDMTKDELRDAIDAKLAEGAG